MTILKKAACLLLAAGLLLGMLSGCGEKEFSAVLLAEEADVIFAPNVILEPEEPPYNLGGWKAEDDVWWYLDLPFRGTYTIRFEYAMPGEYQDNEGWVCVIPDKGDAAAESIIFRPTSTPGTWDTYAWAEMTMELPKGPVTFSLAPYYIPEGQEHFINLRQIQIVSGSGEDSGGKLKDVTKKETQPTKPPKPMATGYDGWWVEPPDEDRPGISIISCIYIDMEAGTCTDYNTCGEPVSEFSCWEEDGELVIDLEFNLYHLELDGDELVLPDDGDVAFVRSAEPEFACQDLDFDGKWYRYGDTESGQYYELEGNKFTRYKIYDGQPLPEKEGTFVRSQVQQYIGDRLFPDSLQLTTEDFGPTLIPDPTGTVLFEGDGFDYAIYVREDSLDKDLSNARYMMDEIMDMDLFTGTHRDQKWRIDFSPFCVSLIPYVPTDDSGFYEAGDGVIYGTWKITGPDTLELVFEDGTAETVRIPEPEGYLEAAGHRFELEPIF